MTLNGLEFKTNGIYGSYIFFGGRCGNKVRPMVHKEFCLLNMMRSSSSLNWLNAMRLKPFKIFRFANQIITHNQFIYICEMPAQMRFSVCDANYLIIKCANLGKIICLYFPPNCMLMSKCGLNKAIICHLDV
jgi:hypothetical protein